MQPLKLPVSVLRPCLIITGVKFKDGIETTKPSQIAA